MDPMLSALYHIHNGKRGYDEVITNNHSEKVISFLNEYTIPSIAGKFLTPNLGNPLHSGGGCLVVQAAGTARMQQGR